MMPFHIPGRKRRVGWLCLLVLLALGCIFGLRHVKAWYHYRAGQAALERYHPDEALGHLNSCLEIWPASGSTHLLASCAARRADRLGEAARHLEISQEQLGASEEVLLEWALQQAAAGDPGPVEPYLQSRLRTGFLPEGPLIFEAIVVGHLRMYRYLDAHPYLTYWLEQQPDHAQALFLRARSWRARRKLAEAAVDYRHALQLDSDRHDARWELALCLVENHDYAEALPLVVEVRKVRPADPDVDVELALCQEGLGNGDEACTLLEQVLNDHPDHGPGLRERGRVALQAGQTAEAERWLRHALVVLPHDLHTNTYLADALARQGKTSEAESQQARARQIKQWMARLREICELEMSKRPHDPALQCEIGVLEARLGRPQRGYHWLLLALNAAPQLPAIHAALADYYEQQGDAAQAEHHRQMAQPAAGPKKS
jgi:tetratricopeptide (TPR) repeat protein